MTATAARDIGVHLLFFRTQAGEARSRLATRGFLADDVIFFMAMLAASLLLDATVRPRAGRLRCAVGLLVHGLVMTAVFGLGLAGSGNAPVAALLALALLALFTVASNAKFTMLGEPVVFSDLALLIAILRHPRFYFTAISRRDRMLAAIAGVLALGLLVVLFRPAPVPHATGVALTIGAVGVLFVLLRGRWFARAMPTSTLEGDLVRYGLIATLLLYWQHWRALSDPPPCPPLSTAQTSDVPPELIVIVQCESYADPVALTGDASRALPGLERARAEAWQYGELAVSGFGAYTMRTEYGVLFGREEETLGLRRYDPFLTALGETSYAMSTRLKAVGYRCTFVHPHDLRFYGRDRLMPAIGFDRLIGEEHFAAAPANGGRYVDDRTLGTSLHDLIQADAAPSLIYAVTMENHGPWDKHREPGSSGGLDAYLRHLRNSDDMLGALSDQLASDGRPALLVFFGDHRPSIPGVIEPGGARHTPYVMLRFGSDGQPIAGAGRVDLSPAGLHHAILRCGRS